MAAQKVTVPSPDGHSMVDGTQVSVTESTERWSEFRLEDGTVLRGKLVVIGAVRLDGKFDLQGNPQYAMQSGATIAIVSVPDSLKETKH
jgi:hypothetical protein